jgi:hypothetical protein
MTVWGNFLNGTILDNPLADVSTSFTSSELADVPVVAAPEHAWVVFDPFGEAGDPEIARITAHVDASTSATISRGQQSTAARQHALGTKWLIGWTAQDANTFESFISTNAANIAELTSDLTDLGDEVEVLQAQMVTANADIDALQDLITSWTTYTPSISVWSVGSSPGVITGAYAEVGGVVHFRIAIVFGPSSTFNASPPRISLPVPMAAGADAARLAISCIYRDSSEADTRYGRLIQVTDQVLSCAVYIVTANLSSTVPHTWVAGDTINIAGWYPI